MKDIMNAFVEGALWLLLVGMAAYAVLCFLVYIAAA